MKNIICKVIILLSIFSFANESFGQFGSTLPQVQLQLENKRVGSLPPYQSGLLGYEGELFAFIMPMGYKASVSKDKQQVIFVSNKAKAAFIFKFHSKKAAKKDPLEKRLSQLLEQTKKVDPQVSSSVFRGFGKPSSALEYKIKQKDSRASIHVFHSLVTYGDCLCEIQLRAQAEHYPNVKRELDLLLMSGIRGNGDNPPIIPELGASI